jgi:predicted dehydrogenase
MLKDKNIDWIMVGSWNCFHSDHMIKALEAGKDVFCEKPLATTLEDCLQIKDAVEKSNNKFLIGFTLRYSPHYRKIKDLLDNNKIGRIISFEFNETLPFDHGGYILANWRRFKGNAGTHILEKCCHDIDIANWLVGSLASKVASFGGLNFFLPENSFYMEKLGFDKNGKKAYCSWVEDDDDDPFNSTKDIIDNQVIIIEYLNGVRATFHANSNAGIPERRMYICGTEGTIRSDVISGQLELKKIGFNEETKDLSTGVSGCHGGGDDVITDELIDAMLGGGMPQTGLHEGLTSAATCFAIDKAMDTSTVIDMNNIWNTIYIQGCP